MAKTKKQTNIETLLGLVFLPGFLPIHGEPCWPAGPPRRATAVSYLWSPPERGPASPETFSYSVSDGAHPLPSSSAAHLYVQDASCPPDGVRQGKRGREEREDREGRGGGGLHLSCAPIGLLVSLCCGDVSPRRPCRAEWTEQPVGVPPKQLGAARHGTARTSPRGIEAGTDCGRRPPSRIAVLTLCFVFVFLYFYIFYFFKSTNIPQPLQPGGTDGGRAPTSLRRVCVCVCVCLPRVGSR